jgi:adenylate cyclase
MTTILVVEDEPDVEALLTQKFRRRMASGEFVLRFARDGQEALDSLAADPAVDLVLADINMPRMDGLTLLARLQEANNPVATVIVSAYGDMANIRTAMNRGAFDFVTKPIDFADLETTIAKTIRYVAGMREARERRIEAERAHAALARYFSPNLAAALADGGRSPELAGARREITTIFTDVADFTRLAEALEPERLADLLNRYLTGMSDIVFAHEGTVAKIMGDALHILFGAPFEQPDHASRAVVCALDLDAFAEALRVGAAAEGIALGATRIGVHSGPALVGDFGGGRCFDYTAYGDTINTAARLETANKRLGTRLCVSAATAHGVEGFRGRPVGDLLLRGRRTPLRVLEPLRPEAAAPDAYCAAFESMAAGAPEALAAFETVARDQPHDPLAAFHLARLRAGERGVQVSLA